MIQIEQLVLEKIAEIDCQSILPKSLDTKLMPSGELWVKLDGKDYTLKVDKNRWVDFNGTKQKNDNAWSLCEHILSNSKYLTREQIDELENHAICFGHLRNQTLYSVECHVGAFDKAYEQHKIKTA